jgi:hypothetical protein
MRDQHTHTYTRVPTVHGRVRWHDARIGRVPEAQHAESVPDRHHDDTACTKIVHHQIDGEHERRIVCPSTTMNVEHDRTCCASAATTRRADENVYLHTVYANNSTTIYRQAILAGRFGRRR